MTLKPRGHAHTNTAHREAGRQLAPRHATGLREALNGDEIALLRKVLQGHERDTAYHQEALLARRLLRCLRAPAIGG